MSTPTRPLDPEIGAILAEVAGDPRAHLLRVPELRVPLVYEAPVGSGAPGLTAAERQLVSVHRADVAQILLEAAQRDLYLRPTGGLALHHEINLERRIDLADESTWTVRARRIVERARTDESASGIWELLAACVDPGVARLPDAIALSVASLRLVPRAEARICLAAALRREEQPSTARRVLLGVIGDRPSQLNLSSAWEGVGNCEWDLEHSDDAIAAYEASAGTLEQRILPVLNQLALYIDLGDERGALRAAERLEDQVDSEHSSVTEYVDIQRAAGGLRSWGRPGGGVSRAFQDSLPSVARRIAHALE